MTHHTDGNLHELDEHLDSQDRNETNDEMDEDDYMQSRQGRFKRGYRWHGDDE